MGVSIYNTPLTERLGQSYVQLLDTCGLRDEGDADIIALMTEDDDLVACGALAGHTIKQLAVVPEAEGQGAMAAVLTELISEASARGIHRLFLCTKLGNLRMFRSLGFHTLVETPDAVLMENRRDGLERFLDSIPKYSGKGDAAAETGDTEPSPVSSRSSHSCGAVVCNCDPFTLGHRHLIEYAASHCDNLYVFAVSEKGSMFSPEERLEMISKGTADIPNCHVFESDLYLISRATFPAYFIRDESRADLVKSDLDIELFCTRIAPALGISIRFAGEEPFSPVTRAYNERMKELLPEHGIEFVEIPRLAGISAGKVRSMIASGDHEGLREMVPDSTYEVIQSRFGSDA